LEDITSSSTLYRKSRLKRRVGKYDAHTNFYKNLGKILKNSQQEISRASKNQTHAHVIVCNRQGIQLQAKHISERIDPLTPKYCMKT